MGSAASSFLYSAPSVLKTVEVCSLPIKLWESLEKNEKKKKKKMLSKDF
jgi:hypothetical protein